MAVGAGAKARVHALQVGQLVEVGLFQQAGMGQGDGAHAGQGDHVVLRAVAAGLELGHHLRGAAGAVGDDLGAGLGLEGFGDVAQHGQAGIVRPGQQAQRLAGELAGLAQGMQCGKTQGSRGQAQGGGGLDQRASADIV